MENNLTRRNLLKTVGLAGTGVILSGRTSGNIIRPEIIPGKGESSAGKVNLALIGIANQGANDARQFINSGLANIVAVCDVDLDSEGSQKTIQQVPKAKQYRDFRVMFDEMAGDIDAVQVVIPDFAYFPVCMVVMQLGKSVYVEKPMSRIFLEAELLAKAVLRNLKIVI